MLAALCVVGVGCGDPRGDFIGSRSKDGCDESWPVCSTVAGCVMGPERYVEGRFPSAGKVMVRLSEPSTVRASFFLDQLGAAGDQTVITFYEDGCRAQVRDVLTGRDFVGEAEHQGGSFRETDLAGVGDHLIEFSSDTEARYLLEVSVTPTRLAP